MPEAVPAGAPGAPELPPYPGITLRDVRVVSTPAQAEEARADLLASDAIGFDTESKPTFLKGEKSTGPHLIQLATDRIAYLFPVGAHPARDVLKAILESEQTIKVGFGLSDDVKRLHAKLEIQAARVLDLSVALRTPGQRNDLGAKTAVAKFFGQKLQKSKKISTTNWATPRLNEKQILYAADDAHVALRIYRHWIAQGGKIPPFKAPKPPRQHRPGKRRPESTLAPASAPAPAPADDQAGEH
ncbi:3'-5' exonuclease [Rugamonas apoptosis]|uniref:3'-5' exonuclease domain-containing protein 2 n=1 Tax=Rugamonas apoptosis TaxID=2758570 RepID=A0A7W2F804_9BURK|nr:3'-5' exonuclease [Rugamonas apoptosis]MBA5686815.1 3'-5' exonuclease domain-containing protein 2 [Rugamonas apoptosis]